MAEKPENQNNYNSLFPMDERILRMPESEKLTVEYWKDRCLIKDLAERFALIKVRDERDNRVKEYLNARGIFESDPDQNYWRHAYGFSPKCEQVFWEQNTGQTIIHIE